MKDHGRCARCGEQTAGRLYGGGLYRDRGGFGGDMRAVARRQGIARIGGAAGAVAFRFKQRPALLLLVRVLNAVATEYGE